jgi:hypothetical protein
MTGFERRREWPMQSVGGELVSNLTGSRRGRPLMLFAIVLVVLSAAGCDAATSPSVSPRPGGTPDAASTAIVTAPPPTAVPGASLHSASGEPMPTPSPLALPLRAAFPAAFTIPSSRALLKLWEGEDISGNHRVLTVYDDGSVLLPWAPQFGGPGVRRLSEQGLAHLRDRLSTTAAFDRSRSFAPAPGWEGGFSGYDFDYLAGNAMVRVAVTNASTDPVARGLMALGDAMRDLPTLLPDPGDWANGDTSVHPFQPVSAIVTVQQVVTGDLMIDLPDERVGVLAGLLPGPIETLGTEATAPDGSRSARCAVVDGRAGLALQEEAARRFDVIETGPLIDSIPPANHPTLGGVDLRSEEGGSIVRIAWRPARPGETLQCDGDALPAAPAAARYQARGADLVLGSAGGIGGDPGTPTHLAVQVTSDSPEASQAEVFYLDDGTVVTFPPRTPLAGFGIRRQTEAGRRLLDAMVRAASLPDTERHMETALDGPTRMYSVIFPDGRVVEAADREQDPEARRIVELVRRLVDPDSTFPGSAWSDPRPLPYRPREVAVTTLSSEAAVVPRATVSMITPPFDPATFGEPETSAPDTRCRVMAIDDAVALARSLRAITNPNGDGFTFATGTPGQTVEVAFELRGPMDTPPRCD